MILLAKIVNANFCTQRQIKNFMRNDFPNSLLVSTTTLSVFLTRVKGEVRVRDGIGDGFRVRDADRASGNAKARGGLGLIFTAGICSN